MHRKIQYAVVGLAIGVILLGCAFAASNNTEAVNASDERAAITTATPKGTEKPEITHLLYTTTDAPTTTNEPTPDPDEEDIEMLAKLIWGEARGVESTTEKAAVVWCVLNRVDAKGYKVTMLIVHHTRKQQADDKFDTISGTNGLLGAADGAFVLSKEKRTTNAATLDITGRDQQDQRIHLVRNPQKLIWEFEKSETEVWTEPPDPLLEKVSTVLPSGSSSWDGTASELCVRLGLDIKPNVLSLRLSINAGRLLKDYGIHYKASRTHGGRKISLWRENVAEDVSMCDDRDNLFENDGDV